MFALLSIATLALSSVLAAPVPARGHGSPCPLKAVSANCTAAAASATPDFPAGQTNLTVPAGQTVEMIALGRGTQNYTCASGAWTSAGALAHLIDVTCLYPEIPASMFSQLPQLALQLPNPPTYASSSNPTLKRIAAGVTGTHYFIHDTSPAALEPKFDFTTTDPADTTKYVTASKTSTLNAPSNPTTNVAWLQLTSIAGQGTLASSVFRVDTAGGQPTGTCASGDTSFVDYAALYYFYH